MSFEQHQQFSGNDQVNGKDRPAESNPQLNLIDLQNGSHNWGHDSSRNNGSANEHLPALSLYDGDDGAHSHRSGGSSSDVAMAGGSGSNSTPVENTATPSAAGNQSSEAGISNTAASTAAGGGEGNMLQSISSTLQTDMTNLANVIQKFTTDMTSAETGLAQNGASTPGADNTAATGGATDASGNSSPSFTQQLQSLMSYLGIPSGNNSSPESTAGTPATGTDTTPPPSTISNPGSDQPPATTPPTPPTEVTQPTPPQNTAPGNAPGTSDTPPAYNTATDPIFNALQAQSPEAAQILSAAQPSQSDMTANGYSNFENALSQTVNGGQYTDVASAGSAAALMLQQSGDIADSALAVNAINSVINQNGDAPLANAATPTPPADNLTPPPPADNTTPTPPANNTTSTDTSPTSVPVTTLASTVSPGADAVTVPPASDSSVSTSTGITTNVNGFFDSNGKPMSMLGLNATPEDAVAGFNNVKADFPGLTAIRLNVNPSDTSDPAINQAIQEYTGAGIAVELEDHDTNGDGSGDVGTYTQWAQQYKSNPLVMLETPNEPQGNVASDQTAIIEAIRAQGFTNPIGIQPIGGYDQSNIPTVLQNLQNDGVSTANMYATPHIYYAGSDPSVPMTYAQSEVAFAQQQGMAALIDEYGPAMDGYTMDPNGHNVDTAMQTLAQSGYGTQASVGSIYWGMDNNNHPNGADSAFLTPDGSQLTPDGIYLQQNTLA